MTYFFQSVCKKKCFSVLTGQKATYFFLELTPAKCEYDSEGGLQGVGLDDHLAVLDHDDAGRLGPVVAGLEVEE